MTARSEGLAHGGVGDLLGVVRDVVAPTLSKGVLRRRPAFVGMLESRGTEVRGIRRLQELRRKYNARAVLLSVFGRKQLIPTTPGQLHRILQQTPEQFQSSSDEKTAALAHFEPGVSLVSDGAERSARRAFNAHVLDEGCPMHSLSDQFQTVVRQEFGGLIENMHRNDESILSWEPFSAAWNRMIRKVVLGESARHDVTLTDMLDKLRTAGNWAFLHPGRKQLRRAFHHRLKTHMDHADPASLAGLVTLRPGHETARPRDQFTHYLFAFDPGGMAVFRALALLAVHPQVMRQARAQRAKGPENAAALLRATLLESLRLWSTTPVILRQSRHDIDWDGDTLPAGTQVMIYAPFFHRDDETLPEAHNFAPQLWPEGRVVRDSRFVPFSDGNGICPARDLVLMIGEMVLDELLAAPGIELRDPARLDPAQSLPPTLDNYTLEFRLSHS